MLRTATKWGAILLLVLLAASFSELGRVAIARLPFGWLHFLARTLPGVSINWSAISMVLLCSALILVTLQWFLGWFYSAFSPRHPLPDRPLTWPWCWTFAFYTAFWFLFAIVIGASGAYRQTNWLLQFTEPLYKERRNQHIEFLHADSEVETAMLETQSDLAKTQAMLISMRNGGVGSWDHHNFLFFTNFANKITSVIILPRDPDAQRRYGFRVVSDSATHNTIPIEKLPDVLAGFNGSH